MKLDLSNSGISEKEILKYKKEVLKAHTNLHEKQGAGSDFLGWVNLKLDVQELEKIKVAASKIRKQSDVLIVIGIGGSYLGSKAVIDALSHTFNPKNVIFAGNNMGSDYLNDLLDYIKDKDISLNVISKSGTTIEPALTFKVLREYIEEKYGEDKAKDRIFVTTDKEKGVLKKLADEKGYETFVVPDDIGGRFSVFTAVGLVPLALAGIDIKALMEGSKKAMEDYSKESIEENDAYKYAVARRILDDKGYSAEMFVTYNLQLQMVAEWWKQLFGESEGKDGKGILPTSGCFSTDLHSLGQFVQEGRKCLYETLLLVDEMPGDMLFPEDEENLDNMNYLAGKSISWVNEQAQKGTLKAHSDNGNVPNIEIHLKDNSAYSFGYMIYFFMRACGMSCYLLGINPFNQPGVEVYKKEMFKLLGKE